MTKTRSQIYRDQFETITVDNVEKRGCKLCPGNKRNTYSLKSTMSGYPLQHLHDYHSEWLNFLYACTGSVICNTYRSDADIALQEFDAFVDASSNRERDVFMLVRM